MIIRILAQSEKLFIAALKLTRSRVESRAIKGDELRFSISTTLTVEQLKKSIIGYAGFFWMEIEE